MFYCVFNSKTPSNKEELFFTVFYVKRMTSKINTVKHLHKYNSVKHRVRLLYTVKNEQGVSTVFDDVLL